MTYRRRKALELLLWNIVPAAAGLLFLYVLVPFCRDVLHIPLFCPFEAFFHLYCPGCGGSRAARALLSLDIVGSFVANPTVLALVLALIVYDVFGVISLVRGSDDWCRTARYARLRKIGVILLTAVFVGQFIVRNVLLVAWQIDPLGDLAAFWMR